MSNPCKLTYFEKINPLDECPACGYHKGEHTTKVMSNPSDSFDERLDEIVSQLSDSSASRGWLDCRSGSEDTHPRNDLKSNAKQALKHLMAEKVREAEYAARTVEVSQRIVISFAKLTDEDIERLIEACQYELQERIDAAVRYVEKEQTHE